MQILEQNKKVLDLNSHVNQLANALTLELRSFAKENGWWRDVVYDESQMRIESSKLLSRSF